MTTLNTFQPLLDRCAAFDADKHDTTVDIPRLSFSEEGSLIVPGDYGSLSLQPEDLALNQLAERLGKTFWQTGYRVIPSEFYRQMHAAWPKEFATFSNSLLEEGSGKFLVRGYGEKVRAILSDKYATLDNGEMLDMASQVLDGVPYEIIESGKYYSRNDGVQRDEMALRVIVKNVKPEGDSPYGLGVMIRNGETGGAASEVRPLIMRHSCMNSIVFKQGEDGMQLGTRLTHLGNKTSKVTLLAAAVFEALPMAAEGLDRFLSTKRVELDLTKAISGLGEEYGWSEELRVTVATGSEGHSSLFGLITGLTFAAHEMEVSQGERVDLESLASRFIYEPAIAQRAAKRAK